MVSDFRRLALGFGQLVVDFWRLGLGFGSTCRRFLATLAVDFSSDFRHFFEKIVKFWKKTHIFAQKGVF